MDQSGEDRKFAVLVTGHQEPVGFTALYGLFRQTAPEFGILIGDRVAGTGRPAEALTISKAFKDFGAHSRLRPNSGAQPRGQVAGRKPWVAA